MLNRGHYPYKWLWDYAGDKFLKPKAHKNFHRRRPTTYYYWNRGQIGERPCKNKARTASDIS